MPKRRAWYDDTAANLAYFNRVCPPAVGQRIAARDYAQTLSERTWDELGRLVASDVVLLADRRTDTSAIHQALIVAGLAVVVRAKGGDLLEPTPDGVKAWNNREAIEAELACRSAEQERLKAERIIAQEAQRRASRDAVEVPDGPGAFRVRTRKPRS